jgi:MYXO-CTERM domain-containing protein
MKPSVLALSLLLGVGIVGVARADLAPPDTCTSPGQPCQSAGPQYNQPGTCTASTCQRSVPSADGGRTSMSYACDLCETTGAGGSNGTGGTNGGGGSNGTGGANGAAGATTHTGGGSSGCALAPGRADGDGPGGVGVLVAIGLAAAFRRRHASH